MVKRTRQASSDGKPTSPQRPSNKPRQSAQTATNGKARADSAIEIVDDAIEINAMIAAFGRSSGEGDDVTLLLDPGRVYSLATPIRSYRDDFTLSTRGGEPRAHLKTVGKNGRAFSTYCVFSVKLSHLVFEDASDGGATYGSLLRLCKVQGFDLNDCDFVNPAWRAIDCDEVIDARIKDCTVKCKIDRPSYGLQLDSCTGMSIRDLTITDAALGGIDIRLTRFTSIFHNVIEAETGRIAFGMKIQNVEGRANDCTGLTIVDNDVTAGEKGYVSAAYMIGMPTPDYRKEAAKSDPDKDHDDEGTGHLVGVSFTNNSVGPGKIGYGVATGHLGERTQITGTCFQGQWAGRSPSANLTHPWSLIRPIEDKDHYYDGEGDPVCESEAFIRYYGLESGWPQPDEIYDIQPLPLSFTPEIIILFSAPAPRFNSVSQTIMGDVKFSLTDERLKIEKNAVEVWTWAREDLPPAQWSKKDDYYYDYIDEDEEEEDNGKIKAEEEEEEEKAKNEEEEEEGKVKEEENDGSDSADPDLHWPGAVPDREIRMRFYALTLERQLMIKHANDAAIIWDPDMFRHPKRTRLEWDPDLMAVLSGTEPYLSVTQLDLKNILFAASPVFPGPFVIESRLPMSAYLDKSHMIAFGLWRGRLELRVLDLTKKSARAATAPVRWQSDNEIIEDDLKAERCTAELQEDGNLVILNVHSDVIWQSGTADRTPPVTQLRITESHAVQLCEASGEIAWSSS
ncbi:hypothetical protein E5Q_01353 [Mixia osmundae IAM 14324]|uniref:Bulb-type lectin domain-containing protein n=2 Tax=Mixia osmundae (strain CBS 9802 / IAM 14324 / JCM 22182 / KY 12970) TaxID=764103 RepID=G7DVU0_MIXOS|nr:hypothetical protein E5Q_01353 [Mixia osmundae IAM 14324]